MHKSVECPLKTELIVISAQIISNSGFKIGENEIKLTLYADGMTLILQDKN
jgi:hypothetical protein